MRSKAIFVALLAFAFGAQAVPVSRDQARSIAQMWAARGKRLGVRMGTEVEEVSEYSPAQGRKFFAVRMKGGTVFTAGDTRANPVLAFTRERVGKLDPKSPLYKLLSEATRLQDPGSPRAVNAVEQSSVRRWAALQAKADRITSSKIPIESEEEIDDVRVSPLLKTKWGQSTVTGADGVETNCFNFYTPPTRTVIKEEMAGGYAETNESVNCVCGCVATAMAQLMRYWCWPQGEVASFENADCSAPFDTSVLRGVFWESGAFQCLTVAQNPVAATNLTTVAGAYDWENMVEVPDGVAVETNCMAIGKLTHDCGVSVGMDYNLSELGGSSIFTSEASAIPKALKNNFSYTNALLCSSGELTSSDRCRQKVIFANLDAKCPVLLLITGSGGHAVVGDGYGFDSGEGETLPYVHLNMGWTGQCDVWYNLPYVNTADNPENFTGFDTIDGVVYNVFTNTTGWIISGRVLDAAGNPVPGAKVTLRDASNTVVGTCEAEGPSGIYVFLVPHGECQYDVFAENADGTKMADRLVDIKNDNSRGSNSWGNDLKLADPTVRVVGAAGGEQLFASLDSALRAATNADDRVEILHTTKLRRDAFLGNDLVLTAVKATPSKIQRQNGATISITNGVSFFTNVVFALEKTTPVLVGSNGTIRVAGRVELDDIASMTPGVQLEDVGGLDLAGELLNGLTIASPATGAGQVFGSYSCDYVTATNSAGRIVTTDPDLVGQAVDGTLKWQSAEEVDPLVAVAYLDGETPAYYRTLDKLAEKIRGEADIVVMRSGCTLTKQLTVTGNSSIRGEGANISVNVVGSSDAAQFTVNSGASLSVSNLTFAAYEGKSLFLVSGGDLTLESGTVIDGAVGTADLYSGVLTVSSGRVTMREGVRILNCRADGADAKGGAILLAGRNCTLNLEGGEISGCHATTYGGGIYVGGKATLNLSGPVNVTGNSSGNNPVDNIYLAADTCSFNLVGEVSGSVGVNYLGSETRGKEGGSFIAVDPSLDPDAVARSCEAFSNDDKSVDLVAAVAEDGKSLVWAERPPYTGEVDPEDAWDLVIYNDGTPQAVTNYYDSFEMAYASLTNDATIVVLGEELLFDDVVVTRKVLIRTDDPEGTSGLYRGGECEFRIDAGGSLTLEDIVVSGYYGGKGTLLNVRPGGSLTLGDGALVCDVSGDDGRAAGGVVVWGGEFRMLPGSEIYNCANNYTGADSPANVSVGGGLLVDHGTAYLEGGLVDGCQAERAAGVYIGNKSTVFISGDMLIYDNYTKDGESSNLTVEDLSELLVTDAFVLGSIGVSEGINCDTNVFGRVPADVLAEYGGIPGATNFVTTAACFHRDDDASVLGQVVTNDTEALLVWPRAIVDGVYVDEQGNSYGQVFAAPCAVPVAPAGLVYNGGAQTGVVENAAYTIDGCSVATNAGQYVAVLTIRPGYLWEDGTAGQKEVTWSIGKATYDMSGITFEDAEIEYDGTPKSIYISGDLPEGVTVEYTGNGQIKVCYKTEVRAHFTGDAENYEPIPYMVAHLTVYSTHPTIPVPPGFSWPYNGQEQVGVMDGVGYTVTGNRATEVGNYTAIASLTGDYRWMDGSADDKEVPWSIIKGNYDMSGVKFEDKTFAADGTPKSIFVDESTLPAGVSVTNYIGNGKTEVGTYQVRAQFAGDAMRYNKISDMFAWMTITDGPLPPPPGPTPDPVYTNSPSHIAFESITRESETSWILVVTNREPYCWYRLIYTDDLTKGFTSTGDWVQATVDAPKAWTNKVEFTSGEVSPAYFWRAEGTWGTDEIPPISPDERPPAPEL